MDLNDKIEDLKDEAGEVADKVGGVVKPFMKKYGLVIAITVAVVSFGIFFMIVL